jgi:hypothetical protein
VENFSPFSYYSPLIKLGQAETYIDISQKDILGDGGNRQPEVMQPSTRNIPVVLPSTL